MAAPVDPVIKIVRQESAPLPPSGVTDVNLAEVAGVATAAGAGSTTAGTQRVVLVDDALVEVNVSEMGGTTVATGAGATDAGTQRIVLANNDPLETTVKTTAAAFGATAVGVSGSDGTNSRPILTDTGGRLVVVGAYNQGAGIGVTPVGIGLEVRTSNIAALGNNIAVRAIATSVGAQVTKSYSIPELDWSYAAKPDGIIDDAELSVKAAAGAGVRNYITWLTLHNVSATGTEFVVLDGSAGAVLWRGYAVALATGASFVSFPSPLKTKANNAVYVQCITTGTQTYVNLGGYTAP